MLVPFSTMGNLIRETRIQKGLSQTELAIKLGFTQGTISRAETGHDLRVATLVEIARALDLEPLLAPRSLVPAIEAILRTTGDRHSAIYRADDDQLYDEGGDDATPPSSGAPAAPTNGSLLRTRRRSGAKRRAPGSDEDRHRILHQQSQQQQHAQSGDQERHNDEGSHT